MIYLKISNKTYLWIQWAAVRIHEGSTSTPPHQWPMKPILGCMSCSEACQGQDPRLLGFPLNILPVILAVLSLRGSGTPIGVSRTLRGWRCVTAGLPHSTIQKFILYGLRRANLQPNSRNKIKTTRKKFFFTQENSFWSKNILWFKRKQTINNFWIFYQLFNYKKKIYSAIIWNIFFTNIYCREFFLNIQKSSLIFLTNLQNTSQLKCINLKN